MENIKNISVILIFVLMIFSCRKDSDVIEWEEETTVAVDGFITGENGDVLSDVAVTIGNRSTITDQYGYFKFDEAISKNEKIYVKASKAGFFPGSRVEYIKATDKKHIRIKMLPMEFKHTFNSSNSATIAVDDKVKLVFPEQSVRSEKGNMYNGEVNVALRYIDPSTSDGQNEMPGNLVGRNTNNEEQSLASYVMVAVELRSPTGEKLNIVDGKKVLMELEIPESIRSNAPQNIPLWYFDEEDGIWIEEGSATKVGNKYEGAVSHFSFWNCDAPYPLVFIKGKVLFDSIPVEAKIKVTLSSNSTSRISHTNREGIFEGYVPKGELLKLEVIDHCNSVLYTAEIGPFNQDETLETINLSATPTTSTLRNLNINVVDCNNNPVKGALIEVDGGFIRSKTNESGNLIYNFIFCARHSTSLRAVDIENGFQSKYVTVLSTSSDKIVLQICSIPFVLDHFIKFKISNGEEFTLYNDFISVDEELRGLEWEAAMLGVPDSGGIGFMLHKQNRSLGKNITLSGFNIFGRFNNDIYEYRNVITDNNDYINYTKLATKDGEFTEGTFMIEGVDKYIGWTIFVESGLTIEGSFKVPYHK